MAARPYMVAANPNGDETTVVLRERLPPIDWAVSDEPVGYEVAVAVMEKRAAQIAAGEATELIWLLEHPPLYTAGTSARQEDLLAPDRFPVFKAGRGGQYTYHGPGQRVAYVMLDVRARFGDVRAFVEALERWVIAGLAQFNVKGEMRPGRVGVWVARSGKGPGSRTRSRQLEFACGGGSASTGSASTWSPTLAISPASCLAASRSTASPASPTWGCRSPCRRSTWLCARLSKRYSGRRGKLSIQWHLATHCAELHPAARLLFGRFWGGRGGCVRGLR